MPASRIAASVMLALWTGSLLTPAAHFTAVHADARFASFHQPGMWFLMAGWTSHIGWFANFLIVACVPYLWANDRPPLWASMASLALALSSFTFFGDTVDFEHGPQRVDRFELGFWLWLLAASVPLLFHGLGWWRDRHAPINSSQG